MNKTLKILFIILGISACSSSFNTPEVSGNITKVSYYSDKFNGRPTASGEIFDNSKFTTAHVNLPFGTKVLLTNVANGDTVTVKVNDRGNLNKERAFDITQAAFKKIGDLLQGIITVEYKILN